jgi:hypothetical protein
MRFNVGNDVACGALVPVELLGDEDTQLHPFLLHQPVHPAQRVACLFPNSKDKGLVKYIDTKAKCRYLKKLTCKGTLRQVFIGFYRLERQSVMLVFLPQLCDLCCPSNNLSDSAPPPPPPFLVSK